MKVNISVPDPIVEKADKFAKENSLKRSQLFSLAVSHYLRQYDVMLCLNELTLAMQKVKESGEITADVKEQMEDWERMIKLLLSGKIA